jgi:hypothetical protein
MTSSIFCHFNKFVATSMLYLWDSKGNLLRLHVGTVRITLQILVLLTNFCIILTVVNFAARAETAILVELYLLSNQIALAYKST